MNKDLEHIAGKKSSKKTKYINGEQTLLWGVNEPSRTYDFLIDAEYNSVVRHVPSLREIGIKAKPSNTIYQVYTIPTSNRAIKYNTKLYPIIREIKESEHILSLDECWDGLDACTIPFKNWEKAILFLVDYSSEIFKTSQIIIPSPEINPCPDGTIDLSWRTQNHRLLINIKNVDEEIRAYYYGDNIDGTCPIKGYLLTSNIETFFAEWMKKLKK